MNVCVNPHEKGLSDHPVGFLGQGLFGRSGAGFAAGSGSSFAFSYYEYSNNGTNCFRTATTCLERRAEKNVSDEKPYKLPTRQEQLDRLSSGKKVFDVLVVGGGATGW